MIYIKIEDEKVAHCVATNDRKPDGYVSAANFDGIIGQRISFFDKSSGYSLKSEEQLISEGLLLDQRGTYWDTVTKAKRVIDKVGVEANSSWTDKEPSGFPYEYWNGSDWEDNAEEKEDYELAVLRGKRSAAFAAYDKYQGRFLWEELTVEQQEEYTAWRQAWLDVTETRECPEALSWFQD